MARHTRYQGMILQGDKILLIQHTQHSTGRSYWVIPGGGLEDAEKEEGCVARKMREENPIYALSLEERPALATNQSLMPRPTISSPLFTGLI